MLETIGDGGAAALLGAFGGVLLGLAARLGRFCSLGAIEDALYGGSTERVRMWGVALGGAIFLSFAAEALGSADLSASAYLALRWSPLAVLVGGTLFGYGMAMAGNCGFGALARLGGGDLRSFVIVVVMGITAYAVMSGPFAGSRVWLFPDVAATAPQGIAHLAARATGLPVAAVGLATGAALLIGSLLAGGTRLPARTAAWGTVVAVAIASAWIGTSWIARTGFDGLPVVSHTFAGPLGATILWVMTASGSTVDFAVGSVAGVLAGAFLGSLKRGQFRWEACEDPRELRRQIGGAACMGVGAVLAMGCTIGQGLSAFSVLAYSAPLAAASIVLGAAIGLRQLITGFQAA
ncbi:YeeE/YedE family protein [Jannaschia sp. W003]|uniref:YeeE/YedE family protein n=1 Tax=Jannaschia sp. W003 TaxID=2867012 RepID=UPI0021A2B553|nr:YeeE/YedE family protein [Jannaschia sp. W003]UWQ22403.1 YeeE/YedE family protein [Jannaschia sp. W003]